MPKPGPKAEKLKREGVETTALQSYFFPSIGPGINVLASSQEEAQEKAEIIRKEMES